ncbi:uncharacterized protein LOC125774933 [Anopheles funestus]|uniref:uncharacterized protein LOC125774933 n=1 Tax=Anopheles funestus TaxID=62324 RepID=UPI0020C65256|nr:uncharacterized protein LOC125774933 [Anopheles funestus]
MRLHELPPYVTEAEIKAALACFGEVLSVTETEYGPESKVPGIKTGIRLVKIILGTPTLQLGPTILVGKERTTVTYSGQNPYCRYCLMPEHTGMGCMQSKRSLVKQGASYAGVTKAAPTAPTQKTKPKPLTSSKTPVAPPVKAPIPKAPATAQKAPAVAPKASTAAPMAPTETPRAPAVSAKATSAAPVALSTAPTPTNRAVESENALSTHAFKVPRAPSPIPSSSKPDPDIKGKRKNDDETDSDASNASIGGTVKRKPGRPPKNPKTLTQTDIHIGE